MKFSLLTLLGVVAIAAVGCAALSHPVQAWAMAVFTAAILLLSSAVVAAVFCRAPARTFWLGFAIFGWIYLLMLWVGLEREVRPTREGRILATTWLLDELASAAIEPQKLDSDRSRYAQYAAPSASRAYATPSSGGIPTPDIKAWDCLLQIGHALWALILAFFGGILARWLYGGRRVRKGP